MKKLIILISVCLLLFPAWVGAQRIFVSPHISYNHSGAPASSDSRALQYRRGHTWITTGNVVYVSADDTPGSSVWNQTSSGGGTTTFAIPHHILTALDNQTGVTVETTANNGDIAIALKNDAETWKIFLEGSNGDDLFFYKGATEAMELTNNTVEFPGLMTALGNISGQQGYFVGGITNYNADGSGNSVFSVDGAGNVVIEGNVGIGTMSPTRALHLHGSGDVRVKLTDDASSAGTTDGFEFDFDHPDTTFRLFESGSLIFLTANIERVRIDSTGNVGLGTTSDFLTGNTGFSIGSGVSPTGGLTDAAEFYVVAGEMWVADNTGTHTQLSEHINGERVENDFNVYTGKGSLIAFKQFMIDLRDSSNPLDVLSDMESYVTEYAVPKQDWLAEQISKQQTEFEADAPDKEFVVDLEPIRAKWDRLPQFLKDAIERP